MFDKEFLEFVESFQSKPGQPPRDSLAVVYGDGSGSIFTYGPPQAGPDLDSASCVVWWDNDEDLRNIMAARKYGRD